MAQETTQPIPLIDLAAQRARISGDVDRAVTRVMDRNAFIMGAEVGRLEQSLSDRAKGHFAISCASGTDALILCLMAAGVGPGDAVFVPSFTFVATAEAVVLAGATPVFVEVEEARFTLNATELAGAIEQTRLNGVLRPAAVIAVDLFGQPADYVSINAVLEDTGIALIADSAQSFGASLNGIPVGALAPYSAVSFYPAKPLGCYGDGGAVFAVDPTMAEVLRSLRDHGHGTARYLHDRIGLNSRLDTIQAAVLIEKLRLFDEELASRQVIAEKYAEQLNDIVVVPELATGATSSWACYTIRTPERDRLASVLSDHGIATAIYYPVPLHRQPPYAEYPRCFGSLVLTESLAADVLSLPIHAYLSEADQERICSVIRNALR